MRAQLEGNRPRMVLDLDRVTLVDVASLEGVFKAVRHRARRFPAFIVNGTERIVGFDRAKLDSALDRVAGKEGEVAY